MIKEPKRIKTLKTCIASNLCSQKNALITVETRQCGNQWVNVYQHYDIENGDYIDEMYDYIKAIRDEISALKEKHREATLNIAAAILNKYYTQDAWTKRFGLHRANQLRTGEPLTLTEANAILDEHIPF